MLEIEPVELIDHPVNVIAERRALRFDGAVVLEQLVLILGADHQGVGDKAPLLELLHGLELGRRGWLAGFAPGIGKIFQVAIGGDLGVFLAQRAGSGVARINVILPAILGRTILERLEIGVGHIDLAANFDHRRPARAFEALGNVADGFEVLGDVFTHRAIAACRAFDEDAVFIAQRGRQAIDLGFGSEKQMKVGIADKVALEELATTIDEVGHVFIGKGIAEAEHGDAVSDLGEAIEGRTTNGNRGAIDPDQCGEALFDGIIAYPELVVVAVRQLGRVVLVIGDISSRNEIGETSQLQGGLVSGEGIDGFGEQLGHGSLGNGNI